MVVSGVPQENGINHAGEIASMALDLVSVCHTFKIPHKPNTQLKIRAGIHSGTLDIYLTTCCIPCPNRTVLQFLKSHIIWRLGSVQSLNTYSLRNLFFFTLIYQKCLIHISRKTTFGLLEDTFIVSQFMHLLCNYLKFYKIQCSMKIVKSFNLEYLILTYLST